MDFIRYMFSIAAIRQLKITQFDIQTAFLNGTLNEKISMQQPQGYAENSANVWLLKRSIYGLKQSPRMWNECFSQFLVQIGLQRSTADDCIFFKNEAFLVLIIYVDDGIIFSQDLTETEQLIKRLSSRFKTNIIKTNKFIGFQYRVNKDGSISIYQEDCIRKVLQRFNMCQANPVSTPIVSGQTTGNDQCLD